jgi:hypothetical protein
VTVPIVSLTEELARFEAAVEAAAWAIVAEVLATEVQRRAQQATPTPIATPTPPPIATPVLTPIAPPVLTPIATPTPVAAADAAAEPAPAPPASGRRPRWTQATIVDELCTWLLGGTAVEASYLRRHGPPGLVAAAKRLFGRFDAALNAANLSWPSATPTAHRVGAPARAYRASRAITSSATGGR